MKVWIGIIALTVFLLAIGAGSGCGGGSGSGSGSGSTDGGNISFYVVEATKNGTIIDPTNIIQGETVQFLVAGYTAAGQRIVQSSSGWVANPPGDVEGTMSGNGSYQATASGGLNGLFTASATAAGQQRSGPARVLAPGMAIVTGRVMNPYNEGVFGAKIVFYDGFNVKVGDSLVQVNGTFRATVPETAVTFEIDRNSIPGYYKEYQYIVQHGSTTVTAGATSTTQLVASTTGMAPGYILHFAAENTNRTVVSVIDSVRVKLSSTITTTTNETVTISSFNWFLPLGQCRAPLPPLSNGTTTPLDADVIVQPATHNGASLPPPPPPSPCP